MTPTSQEDPNPFATDAQGRTALFAAAERGQLAEVRRLIFSVQGTGIFPVRLNLIQHQDHHGLTAADLAEQRGHMEIGKLLRGEASRMEWTE